MTHPSYFWILISPKAPTVDGKELSVWRIDLDSQIHFPQLPHAGKQKTVISESK